MVHIRAIIIDDEKPGRENLRAILNNYFDDVEIIGEASDFNSAIDVINTLKPNLIFLDIELESHSGLDLLDKFEEPSFEVIFVTAFSDYAVKAFRTIATDFIMKPIDIEELGEAIEKAKEKLELLVLSQKARVKQSPKPKYLKVSNVDGLENIFYDKILYLQANNYYTYIVLINGKEIISSKHLKEYQELLKDLGFFRVHNSYIINTLHFSKIVSRDGHFAILDNGKSIKISRRRKNEFIKYLESNRY